MWTGENLFKRFLAEHRGHSGLMISTAGACEWPSVANCGCGAFFMSWTHADGEWSARIGNASPHTADDPVLRQHPLVVAAGVLPRSE